MTAETIGHYSLSLSFFAVQYKFLFLNNLLFWANPEE